MPKNSTHWKHQQMRWKFTLTRSCPKQRHKDFNTIPLMEMCKDFTLVFKLWDKIKILIVAFLQTYFILNILLPCSSVSSLICPLESCAALVVHDLASPCFELMLVVCFMLMVLIRWMLHFKCVKTTVYGLFGWKWELMLSVCWRLYFAHIPWKYSICNFFFVVFLLLNWLLCAFCISECNCFLI